VSRRSLPLLLLAVPLVFWGTGYRVTAIGAEHSDALMFSAVRTVPSLLAGVALLVVYRARIPGRRLSLIMALNGLLMVTLFIWALTDGVARAGAGNASVLVATSPLFTAILSRPLFGEHLGPRRLAGLLAGFAGVAVMFSSELHVAGGQVAVGMVIAIVAGAAWAVGTVIVKAAGSTVDTPVVAGLQYIVGAPALLAIAFLDVGTAGTDWSSPTLWWAVLYVGVGGLLGTLAFFAALRLISATQTTTVQFVVPVVAVLVEVLRGASPAAVTFLGMAIAIVGVALVNVPIRSRRAPDPEAVLSRS
jgi:drug/metabolite transporter (DMT)-like permease